MNTRREPRGKPEAPAKTIPQAFAIGETVEVLCDHKRSGRRVRDWVEGVIVHADGRMTAVQFRSDVYLTDGWMVPDRILWFTRDSEKIRSIRRRARARMTRPAGKRAKLSGARTRSRKL